MNNNKSNVKRITALVSTAILVFSIFTIGPSTFVSAGANNESEVTFEDQNDIEDVEIEVYKDEDLQEKVGDTLTTDSDGQATKDLEDGEYWFNANKEGYYEYQGDFTVDGSDKTVEFAMVEVENSIEMSIDSEELKIGDAEGHHFDFTVKTEYGGSLAEVSDHLYSTPWIEIGYEEDDLAVSSDEEIFYVEIIWQDSVVIAEGLMSLDDFDGVFLQHLTGGEIDDSLLLQKRGKDGDGSVVNITVEAELKCSILAEGVEETVIQVAMHSVVLDESGDPAEEEVGEDDITNYVDEVNYQLTVVELPELTVPEELELRAGEWKEFIGEVKNPENGLDYEAVYFAFTVEKIDVGEIELRYYDEIEGEWKPAHLEQDDEDVKGRFGPGRGFPMGPDYHAATEFNVSIKSTGDYTATADLYDVEEEELVGVEESIEITVNSAEASSYTLTVEDIIAGDAPVLEFTEAVDEHSNDLEGEYEVEMEINGIEKTETLTFENGEADYTWDVIEESGTYTAESDIDGIKGTYEFEVELKEAADLEIVEYPGEITAGESFELVIEVRDEYGNPAGGEEIEKFVIKSEYDGELYYQETITMDGEGRYEAQVEEGLVVTADAEHTITAYANPIESHSVDILVEPAEVDNVEIYPEGYHEQQYQIVIFTGEEFSFTAVAYDEYGNLVEDDDTEFQWINTDGTGLFEGKEVTGHFDVSATYEEVSSDTTRVTVVLDEGDVERISDEIVEEMLEDYLTEEEINEVLEDYLTNGDLTTALEPYMTESEINELLEGYVTFDDLTAALDPYMTEAEINEVLEDYLTSGELTTALEPYMTESEVNELLESYVTFDDLTAALDPYMTEAEINEVLEDYLTNGDLTTALEPYMTESEINELLEGYVTFDDLTAALGPYMTETEINEVLEDYLTSGALTTALEPYMTESEVNELLESYVTFDDLTAALDPYMTEAEINEVLEDYLTNGDLTTALEPYMTESEVNELLESYVTFDNLTAALGPYMDEADIKEALEEYITSGDLLTTALEPYMTESEINELLESYVTFDNLTTALSSYMDETEINEALEAYITRGDLTTALEPYMTESEKNELLEGYLDEEGLTEALEPFLNETEINHLLEAYITSGDLEATLADYLTEQEVDEVMAGFDENGERRDGDIAMARTFGILGIILAILAIIIAMVAMSRKKPTEEEELVFEVDEEGMCPSCGAVIPIEFEECPECGEEVESPLGELEREVKEPKKSIEKNSNEEGEG